MNISRKRGPKLEASKILNTRGKIRLVIIAPTLANIKPMKRYCTFDLSSPVDLTRSL
jgi:hypothetical protein